MSDASCPDPSSNVARGGQDPNALVCPSCWPDDYQKELTVNLNGRYYKRYLADGSEDTSDAATFSAKLYAPVQSGDKITVELRFTAEAQGGVSAAAVTAAKTKLEKGISTYWNNLFILTANDPQCGTRKFSVEYKVSWVTSGQHYQMKIHPTWPREGVTGTVMDVQSSTSAWTYAHEFGHCIGLPDEYGYVAGAAGSVKYIKPDGTMDAAITAPYNGKASTAADATIMAAVDNTNVVARHGWTVAIEVQTLLSDQIGRKISCDIVYGTSSI